MARIPYTNTTAVTQHVDGKTIRPGETRDVDEFQIPSYQAAPAAEAEPGDPVLDILDHNVKAIVEMLPGLSDEDLAELMQAEENGKTRQTLMSAFEAEALARASQRQDDDPGGSLRPGGETTDAAA